MVCCARVGASSERSGSIAIVFWGLLLSALNLTGCLPREKAAPKGSEADDDGTNIERRAERRSKETEDPRQGVSGETSGAVSRLSRQEATNDPILGDAFEDDFERQSIGPNWRTTGSGWQVRDGELCGARARNHPVWLKRRMPINARVEFDAVGHSPDGDIKVEVFGDGKGFASSVSYADATSYILIFGGWKNRFHVLARMDEHGKDRKLLEVDANPEQPRLQPVQEGKRYRFKVERANGRQLAWWVDDILIHSFDDPKPLAGTGHEHFGFNDWEVRVCFDNLKVTPL